MGQSCNALPFHIIPIQIEFGQLGKVFGIGNGDGPMIADIIPVKRQLVQLGEGAGSRDSFHPFIPQFFTEPQ